MDEFESPWMQAADEGLLGSSQDDYKCIRCGICFRGSKSPFYPNSDICRECGDAAHKILSDPLLLSELEILKTLEKGFDSLWRHCDNCGMAVPGYQLSDEKLCFRCYEYKYQRVSPFLSNKRADEIQDAKNKIRRMLEKKVPLSVATTLLGVYLL